MAILSKLFLLAGVSTVLATNSSSSDTASSSSAAPGSSSSAAPGSSSSGNGGNGGGSSSSVAPPASSSTAGQGTGAGASSSVVGGGQTGAAPGGQGTGGGSSSAQTPACVPTNTSSCGDVTTAATIIKSDITFPITTNFTADNIDSQEQLKKDIADKIKQSINDLDDAATVTVTKLSIVTGRRLEERRQLAATKKLKVEFTVNVPAGKIAVADVAKLKGALDKDGQYNGLFISNLKINLATGIAGVTVDTTGTFTSGTAVDESPSAQDPATSAAATIATSMAAFMVAALAF